MSRKRVVSDDGKIIVTKVEKEQHAAFMRWCKNTKVSAGSVLRQVVADLAKIQISQEQPLPVQSTNEPLPELAVQPPAWHPASSAIDTPKQSEPYIPSILS